MTGHPPFDETEGHRLVAALARDRVSLKLDTLDICYLVGLFMRADAAALTSFEEDELIDIFEQICDAVESGAEFPTLSR